MLNLAEDRNSRIREGIGSGTMTLVLYPIGMIMLVMLLLALAGSNAIDRSMRFGPPFLYSILLVWSVAHVSVLLIFARGHRRLFTHERGTVDILVCLAIV